MSNTHEMGDDSAAPRFSEQMERRCPYMRDFYTPALAEDTGSSHGSKDFYCKAGFANNKCEIRIFLKGIF